MTTTSGLFGRVGEFNAEREKFKAYVERMELLFTVNNMGETPGEGSLQANQVVTEKTRHFPHGSRI